MSAGGERIRDCGGRSGAGFRLQPGEELAVDLLEVEILPAPDKKVRHRAHEETLQGAGCSNWIVRSGKLSARHPVGDDLEQVGEPVVEKLLDHRADLGIAKRAPIELEEHEVGGWSTLRSPLLIEKLVVEHLDRRARRRGGPRSGFERKLRLKPPSHPAHQVLLRREVVVEGGGGEARASRDLPGAQTLEPPLRDEVIGGVDDGLLLPLALRGVVGAPFRRGGLDLIHRFTRW